MYKKGSSKKTSPPKPATVVEEEEEEEEEVEEMVNTDALEEEAITATPEVATIAQATDDLAELVELKEKFMAPFLVYDATQKKIVTNPKYDRQVGVELSRLQAIVVSVLRPLRGPQQTPLTTLDRTPKELLYNVSRALYYLFCATIPFSSVATTAFRAETIVEDAQAAALLPELERALSSDLPVRPTTVAAVGYVLSTGLSKSTLEPYLQELEQRVTLEQGALGDKKKQQQRTTKEREALQSTLQNCKDIRRILTSLQVAYNTMQHASNTSAVTEQLLPKDGLSAQGNLKVAQMLRQEYFNLLSLLLTLHYERVETPLEPVSLSVVPQDAPAAAVAVASSEEEKARITSYDTLTGKLTIERPPNSTSPWGLVINKWGYLIGIENFLRTGSESGQLLSYALQGDRIAAARANSTTAAGAHTNGFAVLEINRHKIRNVHLSDTEIEKQRGAIMEKIASILKAQRPGDGGAGAAESSVLHMVLEKRKAADMTKPFEVHAELSGQGGEAAAGQRMTLVLQRSTVEVPWGLSLSIARASVAEEVRAVVTDFSNDMVLSAKTKDFLFDHRGRLQMVQANFKRIAEPVEAGGPDTEATKQVMKRLQGLMKGTLLLTLQLQVLPASEKKTSKSGSSKAAAAAKKEDEEEDVAPEAVKAEEEEEAEEEAEIVEKKTSAKKIADAKKQSQKALELDEEDMEDIEEAEEEIEVQPKKVQTTKAKKSIAATRHDDEEEEDELVEGEEWANPENLKNSKIKPLDDAEVDDFLEPPEKDEEEEGEEEKEDKTKTLDAEDEEDDAHRNLLEENGIAIDDEEIAEGARKLTADDAGEEEDPEEELEERRNATAVDATNASVMEALRSMTTKNLKRPTAAAAVVEEEDLGEMKTIEEKKTTTTKRTRKPNAKKSEKQREAEEAAEEENFDIAEALVEPDIKEKAIEAGEEEKVKKTRKPRAKATKKRKGKKAKAKRSRKSSKKEENKEEVAEDADDDDAEEAKEVGEAKEPLEATIEAPASHTIDKPLIATKSTAEVVMEEIQHQKAARLAKSTKPTTQKETVESAAEAAAAPKPTKKTVKAEAPEAEVAAPKVGIAELMAAPPLVFDNSISVNSFDGTTLELQRPSLDQTWDIKLATSGNDVLITQLPPLVKNLHNPTFSKKTIASHPYLRSLRADPNGRVNFIVDSVNGKDTTFMSRSEKAAVLNGIKKKMSIKFGLRRK